MKTRGFRLFFWMLLAVLAAAPGAFAQQEIPQTIAYQGYLTNTDGEPFTGIVSVTFRLYDDADHGTQLWQEVQLGVVFTDGVFSVQLGSVEPLDGVAFDQPLWLGVSLAGIELSPRVPLSAVPYAMRVPGLRVEPAADPAAEGPNVIGGWRGNSAADGVTGATISGGGTSSEANVVSLDFGTIGGGLGNTVVGVEGTIGGGRGNTADQYGTIGGGKDNATSEAYATVGGGSLNQAVASHATIGGGRGNRTFAVYATISGGADNTASFFHATVGGGDTNTASGNAATVGGGLENTAGSNFTTVGGGHENIAGGEGATTGGGTSNEAKGQWATIGGGRANVAEGIYSNVAGGIGHRADGQNATVAGGISNLAAGDLSAVGGGGTNRAVGEAATVPGGIENWATGRTSLAAGQKAKALHDGTFVWADRTEEDFESTGENQFLLRAAGGVGIGTNAPLAPLHLRSQHLSLPASALLNEDLTLEAGDAVVGLYSDASQTFGSALSLGQITGGSLDNKWTLVRRTPTGESPNTLQFRFGDRADYAANALVLELGTRFVQPGQDNTLNLGNPSRRWAAVYATNGTIQTSDRRLKQDIADLIYGLAEVLRLRPVTYRWRDRPETGVKVGLIAQDVAAVVPEVVHGDAAEGLLGMNYAELVPVLIQALQEQQGRIDALAAEVAALRSLLQPSRAVPAASR